MKAAALVVLNYGVRYSQGLMEYEAAIDAIEAVLSGETGDGEEITLHGAVAPWIAMTSTGPGPTVSCARCLASATIVMPCNVEIFVSTMRFFMQLHRECRPADTQRA